MSEKMKYLASVLLSGVLLTGCSSHGGSDQSSGDTLSAITFSDSLSEAYGRVVGAQLNMSFASLPADKEQAFDRKAFLAGVRNALMLDATEPGVIDGLWRGVELAEQLDYYDAVGIRLDRKKVASSFGDGLNAPSVDTVAYNSAQDTYDRMMTSVQHLILEKMREDRRQQMMLAQKRRNANIELAHSYVEKLQAEDPSVVKTETGLFYKILKNGTGARPRKGASVEVSYTISTLEGHLVDSSRGEAVPVEIGGSTIQGLQEGLPLMPEGSKYRFFVPSHLGFVRTTPGVEPGEMLVIDVELVKA